MNLAEVLNSYEIILLVLLCLDETFLYCAFKFLSRTFRVLNGYSAVRNFKIEVNITLCCEELAASVTCQTVTLAFYAKKKKKKSLTGYLSYLSRSSHR